ncbi:MAG: polysaccharide export protein [Desulfobacterales bacterium]|nr:polysaccharide export protein [Desulfobacterales bacterium]
MTRIKIGGIILLLSLLFFVPLALAEELATKAEEPIVNTEEPAVKAEEPAATTATIIKDARAAYTVGVGDVLTIRLREGVKLSESDATVMSTGTIVISFIEVEAAGHTIPEIREQAQKELGKYIRDFSVDLIPKEWREKKIFVLGEVEKPGVYNFSAGMTTVQALALAGGYKNTAVLSDMRIIRGNLDNPELIRVDLHKTAKGRDAKDVLLAQNDVIFVPRSAIGNWNNFINLYIRPTMEVLTLPLGTASTAKTLAQ